jgi:hypothetical protein
MPKYIVEIPYLVFVTVTIEAENEEEAIDIALDEASIGAYCGNGGHDKLIGVTGDASIYCDDCPITGGDAVVGITVEVLP